MSDEFRIADELIAVERSLAELQPRATKVNRERLLYLAGQATALASAPVVAPPKAKVGIWPLATILSTSVAVVFAVLYFGGRVSAQPEIRFVTLEQPARPATNPDRRSPSAGQKQNRNQQQPKRFVAEMPATFSSPFRMESAMLRSRHPILTTDVDRLPLPVSSGSSSGIASQTLQEMRLSLVSSPKPDFRKFPNQSSGFGLFHWPWPSKQGDRL